MWTFETTLRWDGKENGVAECAGKPPVAVSSPPEFGGLPGHWTPEDLLVSAIETCLMMTTLSVLNKQKINLKAYSSKATGAMAKTSEGLRFTGLEVIISLQVTEPAEIEKVVKAVAIAEKYCPISNAVKFPVKVTAQANLHAG
jgi:organic hydroperoxide reductase OsmC/OhrA